MYKEFSIKNYRCFPELKLKNLSRVNLIGGVNNVGKTTVLEALWIHAGLRIPELALRLNAFRGIEKMQFQQDLVTNSPWEDLFNNLDPKKQITIISDETSKKRIELNIHTKKKKPELRVIDEVGSNAQRDTGEISAINIPMHSLSFHYKAPSSDGTSKVFLDPQKGFLASQEEAYTQTVFHYARAKDNLEEIERRFSKLEVTNQSKLLLDTLKILEPRLTSISLANHLGQTMLHGDIGIKKKIPLALLGDGISRLVGIILALSRSENGIVLIDEFENGLHHSKLAQVWKAINHASREFNTQVFATTHSYECVTAAYEAFADEKEFDFGYHRLDRVDDVIDVKTYSKESLESAIELNFEVR